MFEKIDELYKYMRSLPPLSIAADERLMEEFTIRYTYNTNAIEGSTLTEQDTFRVLKEDMAIEGKPLRFHLDAIGHREAFALVRMSALIDTPLSVENILNIHNHVLLRDEEERGHFRTVSVYISGSDVVLPEARFVPQKMAELLEWYHGEMQTWHPIKRAAVFHLAFESIHPFVDGNGRTGRLLVNYELMKAGYPPIDIKYVDKGRYFHCIQSYQGEDRIDLPMIYMLQEYMELALKSRIQTLEESRTLRGRIQDKER